MKVLVYENRKQDPQYWDASTPEKENAAFERLYQLLRDSWEVYVDLAEELEKPTPESEPPLTAVTVALPTQLIKEIRAVAEAAGATAEKVLTDALQRHFPPESHPDPFQVKLYTRAQAGDVAAMKKLMKLRRDYEYEHWTLAEVEEP